MYARIYDKEQDRYYKSIVYCGINHGYYRQYVVLNPYTDCFELVDYLDKSNSDLKPLVEIIQYNHEEWRSYQNALLLKYKHYCKKNNKEVGIDFLLGYPDVCENHEFISSIIERKSVTRTESGIFIRNLSDANEWNYIQTQDEANEFMKLFAGFHDSTLEKLYYEDEQGSTNVVVTFDNSGWYGIVELCFEGVLAINIRPAKENYSRDIYEGTLLIHDETVLWADWYMENEDLSFDGSYIKALNLKWRKIG